jgi:hypothetical protein
LVTALNVHRYLNVINYHTMDRGRKQRITVIAVIGLWELFVLHQALAGPGQPLEKVAAALNHESGASRPAPSLQPPRRHLDLRPPSEFVASSDAMDSAAASAGPLTAGALSARPASARPKLFEVTASSSSRTVETMANNFRQQGLPVARLFENKDSLVHLGLNQKGKPGLWIIHKLH